VEIIAQVDLHGKLLVIKKIKWGSTLIFFNNLREKLAEREIRDVSELSSDSICKWVLS
jgi:hypothetical protein